MVQNTYSACGGKKNYKVSEHEDGSRSALDVNTLLKKGSNKPKVKQIFVNVSVLTKHVSLFFSLMSETEIPIPRRALYPDMCKLNTIREELRKAKKQHQRNMVPTYIISKDDFQKIIQALHKR